MGGPGAYAGAFILLDRVMQDHAAITLRAATSDDRAVITDACRETFERHRAALPFAFREDGFEAFYARYIEACFQNGAGDARDGEGVVQVAEYDGRMAGYVILSPSYSTGGGFEIFDIHVFAPFRGKGVGRQLLEWAKARAKEREAHNLDATVWALGDDRAAFFEKAGFAPVNGTWRIGPQTPPPAQDSARREGGAFWKNPSLLWLVIAVLAALLVAR